MSNQILVKLVAHLGELTSRQNCIDIPNQLHLLHLILLGRALHQRDQDTMLWFLANSLDEIRLDTVPDDHLRQFRTTHLADELGMQALCEVSPGGAAAYELRNNSVIRQSME